MIRMALALAALMMLAGCGAGSPKITATVKCPAVLPDRLSCKACATDPIPDWVTIEELKATMLETAAQLKDCRAVNDECVRRDRVVGESWEDCP